MRARMRSLPRGPSVLSLVAVMAVVCTAERTPAAQRTPRGAEKRTKVVLEKRAGGEYANSAYSFFLASRGAEVHRNMVDLFYGNCGLLHFNAYGGSGNRVARLGEVDYASVRKVPREGWLKGSVRPLARHVYVFDGGLATPEGTEKYAVKFVVTAVAPDSVTIEWTPLGEMPKPPGLAARMARAETAGLCGMPPHGEH